VSDQYARWIYPQPILDIEVWCERNWQWFDPSHAYRLFWPNQKYRSNLDILVAGCGTNQAAVIAFNNPEAKVTAIDISQPSLDHHAYLKAKHRLDNLELHLLPIEDVGKLHQDFDLIMSTGVLHHLASPEAGMAALASCLRPDGVAAIMLYARFGRAGVEMLQSVFREMGLKQSDTSLVMVREAIEVLPPDHPLQSYLKLAPDLKYDAGLVDTFLHGRDRSYTVDDCIDLVSSAGLVFQDLFQKTLYYPASQQRSAFYSSISDLPDRQQWSIMERINHRNACHFFMACHPSREPGSYTVRFDGDEFSDYIPQFRYRCGVNGHQVYKPNSSMGLAPSQSALIKLVDGKSSIADLIAEPQFVDALGGKVEAKVFARNFFRSLWRMDFVAFELPGTPKRTNRKKAIAQV
jgi:SAM-dependent methyltransferase